MGYLQTQSGWIGLLRQIGLLAVFTENEAFVFAEEVYHDIAKESFSGWF